MKTIVIDRSKWIRALPNKEGGFFGETELLNEHGNMCCLGFICNQTGTSRDKLLGLASPGHVVLDYGKGKVPSVLINKDEDRESVAAGFDLDSKLSEEAMSINDAHGTSNRTKEAQLKRLFAGVYDLKFVGRTPTKAVEDDDGFIY